MKISPTFLPLLAPLCLMTGWFNEMLLFQFLMPHLRGTHALVWLARFVLVERILLSILAYGLCSHFFQLPAHGAKKSKSWILRASQLLVFCLILLNLTSYSNFSQDRQMAQALGIAYENWTLVPLCVLATSGLLRVLFRDWLRDKQLLGSKRWSNKPLHFLWFFVFCLVGPLQAQPQESNWMKEKWTQDGTPYKRIRLYVDKFLVTAGPALLLNNYEQQAKRTPRNPQAQFRWAYATYRAASTGFSGAEGQLLKANSALLSVASPQVAEWTRLRFLIAARNFPDPALQNVGRRLAQHDPKDYEVRYRLIATLNPGESVPDKKEALLIANQLIALSPKKASAYSALGGIYYRSWLLRKNRSDAKNAIAAYKQYIQLAPQKEPFRKQVTSLLVILQKQ